MWLEGQYRYSFVRRARQAKQVAFFLFKTNPSPATLSVYKAESRRLSNLMRLSRRQYDSKLADEMKSTGHRRKRPRDSPRRDLHRVSPLHRGCEYSKAFAVLDPKILLWNIQDSVYPALLCLNAASSRICSGGQLPNSEGGYKPTWEGPTPCNTASERSSSRAIWGKASPTQPLLAGTQTPPSWPHPDLQIFQRRNWP